MKFNFLLSLMAGLLAGEVNVAAFQVQPNPRTFFRSSRVRSSLMRNMVISVSEGTPRDVASFDQWAAGAGVEKAGGFYLDTPDGMDYSAFTAEPIQAGSLVLKVPSYMILSATRAQEELDLQPGMDTLGRLGGGAQAQDFALFVKLLTELEQGENSSWFTWLNSLPRLFFNAVSMTNLCYECLPPLVFSLSRTERVRFDNFMAALKNLNVISEQLKSDNEETLKWAFNVVSTRTVMTITGDKQIIPMADMFNHGTETEVDFQYDEEGNCFAFATKDVEAGSQLRMSYGDPTNPSALFAKYGFLDESSPATFCKIMNIQSTEELRNIGLDFSRMLFYKDTGDVSQEVWDVLLYDFLKVDKDAQQAFYQAHMQGNYETKQAFHEHYLLQTSSALKNHVDTFLTSLDGLLEKTVGKDINEHPRIPVIVAHNEFVKETFLRVKARIDPIAASAAGEYIEA